MPQELDTSTIAILLFLGVLAHVGLVAISKFINPVTLLAAVFMLLSPLAVAEITGQVAAKWARVYLTLLIFVLGLFYSKHYKLGPAFGTFLVFAGMYFFAGVYSDLMFQAIKFKGLYIALVLAGGFTAYSFRDEADLRRGIRVFVATGALIAVIMLTDFVKNPAAISSVGRFEPWGIIATRVGAICGPLGITCAFCALYDPVKMWKIIAYSAGGALCLCIIYSGSRGGLFMAGIGCFIIGLPVIKRPFLAGSVLVGALLALWVVTTLSSAGTEEATSRLTEVNFDSRADKWVYGRELFADKFMFGHGWVYETDKRETGTTANMHSMYLQIAVEMGVFGLIIFGVSFATLMARMAWVLKTVRVDRRYNELAYYAVGLCIAVFCYGIVESAVITGGTIVGLLLPFSIALVDRISEFIREDQAWALAYDDGYDDGSGGWDHEGHDDGDDSWDHEHNADDEGHHHGDHESPGYHDARWETHDYAEEGSVDGH